MRINNVVLSTVIGSEDLIKFPFRDTRMQTPFVVKSMSGLDALDIASSFAGFSADSTAYFDKGLPKRTIIMRLGLNPTFRNARSHSDLRDELYRIISADRTGRIVVNFCLDEHKIAQVEGSITKLETNHFEKSPEAQVTIVCDDGLLRSPTVNNIDVSTFGRVFSVTDCISTAPHGFYVEFNMLAVDNQFTFKSPNSVFSFSYLGNFEKQSLTPNDRIKIWSDPRNRDVRLLSNGVEKSILELLSGRMGSNWPVLYPGKNQFELITNAQVVKFEYQEVFWGI